MANNLDAEINKTSFEIVNQKIVDENQINKMLGVLANDGVYACYVYVKSKEIDNWFLDKLKEITKFIDGEEKDLNQKYFEDLSGNLNNLLFFRDILEKILIYARYHAKAMGD